MQPLSALVTNGLSVVQRSFGLAEWRNGEEETSDDLPVPLPEAPSTDEVSAEETASLLARDLSSLTSQDRERVYSDVHCVSQGMIETPQLNQDKLAQMQRELNQLGRKPAYSTALSMDRDYVMDNNFRLRFLRAELYDPREAALRYSRFFEMRMELFGPTKLVKDIVQDDLDEGTMEAIYSGFAQFLPKRDRAGRKISVNLPHPTRFDRMSRLRRSFYAIMVQSKDVETQRNGVVSITYTVGQRPSQLIDYSYIWKFAQLNRCMPIRVEAFHILHDSTLWATAFAFVKMSLSRFTRLRLRDHRVASHQESLDLLQRFGIPTAENFPVTKDGFLATKNHRKTWEECRASERLRTNTYIFAEKGTSEDSSEGSSSCSQGESTRQRNAFRVGLPGRQDVLLGRGRTIYTHEGNVRFREMVEHRREDYDKAETSVKKHVIIAEIVDAVKKVTGHFLKEDVSSGWVEIDTHAARKKVAHTFRTMRGSRKRSSERVDESNGNEGREPEKGRRRRRAKKTPEGVENDSESQSAKKRPRLE